MRYPSHHDSPPDKIRPDDRVMQCIRCEKWIVIPQGHVGGAWHLSGWASPNGVKHYGTHCVPCFDELHEEK